MSPSQRQDTESRESRSLLATLLSGAVVCWPALAFAVIVANTPDDVCPPAADPCQITDTVVFNSALLDFGTRTVEITGKGQLDFGYIGELRCGSFIVQSDRRGTPVIKANRLYGNEVVITAQRACSGNPSIACLDDSVCTAAAAGSCSVGEGKIDLGGSANVSSKDTGGDITLQAADDVTLRGDIIADGIPSGGMYNWAEAGNVWITSSFGSVEIDGPIRANSLRGIDSVGGVITLTAAQDLIVNQRVAARGPVADSGMYLTAGRDIVVNASLSAVESGWVDLTASRDALIGLNGKPVALNSGGDGGGEIDIWADRDIALGEKTRIKANGYGFYSPTAGTVSFHAGGSLACDARIQADGRAGAIGDARGGDIELYAVGEMTLGPKCAVTSRTVVATGYGGSISVTAQDLVLAGKIIARGQSVPIRLLVDGNASVSGRILDTSRDNVDVSFEACRIDLLDKAMISSKARHVSGYPLGAINNILTGREHINFSPRSRLTTRSGTGTPGVNQLIYRDANKPPEQSGKISPNPTLVVDPTLVGCPVCGNGEIDQGETCDDGNTTSGDGCSATCQIE